MTTVYVFALNENKYYLAEFTNDIIDPIETMIKKIVPNNNYDLMESLLAQNLINSIASIEWIKKYPFKSIVNKVKNTNIEDQTIYYMKKYGIGNVRSDLHKDIELSEKVIKYFQTILNDSNKSTSDRIILVEEEINKLKSIFNIITKNNAVIDQYKDYKLRFHETNHGISEKIYKKIREIKEKGNLEYRTYSYSDQVNSVRELEKLCTDSINVLVPNFIDKFIKDKYSNQVRLLLEEHFSNHKIIDEISNALILEKKNEKLISKYGTLIILNNKLLDLLNKKIELIRMLDISEIEVDETYVSSDEKDEPKKVEICEEDMFD